MSKTIINNENELFEVLGIQSRNGNHTHKIKLSNVTINYAMDLNRYNNLSSLSFDECTFNDDFKLNNPLFDCTVLIEKCEFNQLVNFDKTNFKRKVRIKETHFNEKVTFKNSKFHDLIDFWASKFYKPIIFYKTDFLGTAVFSEVTFKENVLFTYSLIEKISIFKGTKFNKGLDFSLAIISGRIEFFNVKISNFNSLKDIEFVEVNDQISRKANKESHDEDIILELEVKNNVNRELYLKKVSHEGSIFDSNKVETFRIIKEILLNQHNYISYLDYYAFEVVAQKEKLWRKIIRPIDRERGFFFLLKRFMSNFNDYSIIILNQASNNNGRSFSRGFIFTFSIAIIFFYLSVLSTEKYNFCWCNLNWDIIESNLKYFGTFLLPTHPLDYLDDYKPKPLFYILDFFGRTMVSYGIYQTIQAFRKFRK